MNNLSGSHLRTLEICLVIPGKLEGSAESQVIVKQELVPLQETVPLNPSIQFPNGPPTRLATKVNEPAQVLGGARALAAAHYAVPRVLRFQAAPV
jgi:hypothetical protein